MLGILGSSTSTTCHHRLLPATACYSLSSTMSGVTVALTRLLMPATVCFTVKWHRVTLLRPNSCTYCLLACLLLPATASQGSLR